MKKNKKSPKVHTPATDTDVTREKLRCPTVRDGFAAWVTPGARASVRRFMMELRDLGMQTQDFFDLLLRFGPVNPAESADESRRNLRMFADAARDNEWSIQDLIDGLEDAKTTPQEDTASGVRRPRSRQSATKRHSAGGS